MPTKIYGESGITQVQDQSIELQDLSVSLQNEVGKVGIRLGEAKTASGTAVDFTGIPIGVKRITVMFDGVSTNGASPTQIQLGTNLGIETSGYASVGTYIGAVNVVSGISSTTGFLTQTGTGTSVSFGGMYQICNLNQNKWTFSSTCGRVGDVYVHVGGGTKSLSNTLDRIRITTLNGTDQFDAGTINISWEF